MRLLQLCADRGVPLGGPKGCSVHLREFVRAARRLGHDVSVVVAERGDAADVASLEAAGIEVRDLRAPWDEREVEWHLSRVLPDLVIERLALDRPSGALAATAAGIPHLYEVNAPLDEEAQAHRGLADPEAARRDLARGFAASRGALAVSSLVGAWVRRLAPADFPVEVLANGASRDLLTDPDAARTAARRLAFDIAPIERTVGFLGSFRPWHDLPGLMRAMRHVRETLPAKLVLVGDGPMRNEVLAQAHALHVPLIMVGRVPHAEVGRHLALCDVVAVPYAREQDYFSPLKLLEAMAAGRAVVASATDPVRALVRDREDAWLVPPGDDEAMGAALAALLHDEPRRLALGAAARLRVRECHTWEHVFTRALQFADRCIGGAVA